MASKTNYREVGLPEGLEVGCEVLGFTVGLKDGFELLGLKVGLADVPFTVGFPLNFKFSSE
jgi:hypothetical protein